MTGEEGEHLLGDEATAQSGGRLIFEHGEGQGLTEAEAWRYTLWMLSAGHVWRPAKEHRLSLCVRVSVQPKRRRRGGEVEEEVEAVGGRCSLCMGWCRVRL